MSTRTKNNWLGGTLMVAGLTISWSANASALTVNESTLWYGPNSGMA